MPLTADVVCVCVCVNLVCMCVHGPPVSIARKDKVSSATKGLNPLVCNFGDVKLGGTCMIAVTLHNYSPATAYFQFQVRVPPPCVCVCVCVCVCLPSLCCCVCVRNLL